MEFDEANGLLDLELWGLPKKCQFSPKGLHDNDQNRKLYTVQSNEWTFSWTHLPIKPKCISKGNHNTNQNVELYSRCISKGICTTNKNWKLHNILHKSFQEYINSLNSQSLCVFNSWNYTITVWLVHWTLGMGIWNDLIGDSSCGTSVLCTPVIAIRCWGSSIPLSVLSGGLNERAQCTVIKNYIA